MKKILLLSVICLLTSCAIRGEIMSMQSFEQIKVGESAKELVEQFGEPDFKRDTMSRSYEYEYIERIIIDERNVETRHYYFNIRDGKIISKRIKKEKGRRHGPLLERNAYDIQNSSLKQKF